jgi:hypothetical protein
MRKLQAPGAQAKDISTDTLPLSSAARSFEIFAGKRNLHFVR